MYVVADVGMTSHSVDNGVAQVFGIAGCETNAHLGSGFGNHRQESGEVNITIIPFVEIGIHILPKQCHLFETACLQVAEFVENALRLTAALTAACVRHNAVSAEVVATSHYRDKTAGTAAAQSCGNDIAVSLGGRELHVYGFLSRFGSGNESGELKIAVWTCHEVHSVLIDEFVFHAFGHTPDDANDKAALTFATQCVEGVESCEDSLLGIVAHAAGVDEYCIGGIKTFGCSISRHLHHTCHNFAVGNVHLAAVGLQKQFLGELLATIIF